MENKFYTHKRRDRNRKEEDTNKSTVDDTAAVDELTRDILSRLAVRSLTRFKLVCKHWLFLVEKDSYFKDSHFSHSKSRRNFFCVVSKPSNDSDGPSNRYMSKRIHRKVFFVTGEYLSFGEGRDKNGKNILNRRKVDVPYFASFFGPLNGLVGFYDSKFYSGVCISNVCTHETTPLLKSAIVRKYRTNKKFLVFKANCQLGFDPITKKYKVVCICNVVFSGHGDGIFCEVLTLGDHKWKIYKVPSNVIDGFNPMCSVYLNGSIYYSSISELKHYGHANGKIGVFDVGSEKFSSIELPKFSVDNHCYDVHLLESNGRLALLSRVSDCMAKLWLYYDVAEDCKGKNCWSELNIELPYVCDIHRMLTFHSVVGKEEIILKSYQQYSGGFERNHSYHLYNWRNKSLKQIEISRIPSSIPYFFNRSEYVKVFTESILSVQ